jgi:hypothetical protein
MPPLVATPTQLQIWKQIRIHFIEHNYMAFSITHFAKHDQKKPMPKKIEISCKIIQQD